MGGLSPMPPSSAYCVQRSLSISSAAARNRRIAISPAEREPLPLLDVDWAKVDIPRVIRPVPMVAAPAANALFFKNARRVFRASDSDCFICLFFVLKSRLVNEINCIHWLQCRPATCRFYSHKFFFPGFQLGITAVSTFALRTHALNTGIRCELDIGFPFIAPSRA